MMRAWLCVGLLFAVGCKERPPEPPAKVEPPAQQHNPSDVKPTVPAPTDPLQGQLTTERSNRPKGTPTVEQVTTAVEAAGIKLKSSQQVVAKTVQAHYCSLSMTTEGLGLAICEYDDEAKAKAGRDYSEKAFKMMKGRTLLVNGKTMLTVNNSANTPAVNEQNDKVIALFKGLKAN